MIANWIVEQLPPHDIYVEPFGGGASVLFAKPPVGVEVYNDINISVYNFFDVLKSRGDEFIRLAALTPYHEHEFVVADPSLHCHSDTEMELALCDFIRWRQSFGAQGKTWVGSTRPRGGMSGNVNAWLNAVDGLPAVVERLRRVEFHCKDALEVIRMYDRPNAVIYCDPPYVSGTRAARDVYTYEYTDEQHRELADKLSHTDARVCLSGYESPLYDELYYGWRKVSKDVANHAAGGTTKRRMTETLWMNY